MAKTSFAIRIPESMNTAHIGPYLQELRTHFQLTPQEVSERLHIRVRYVTAMEEGRFDQLPGKVYARGYLHTYAEFLGLDADQVVAQCFTGEGAMPAAAPALFVPSVSLSSPIAGKTHWRGIGFILVFGLLALVAYTQWMSNPDAPTKTRPTVAPVPEAMLTSARDRLMPVVRNYECLMETSALSCFFAQETLQEIARMHGQIAVPLAETLSLTPAVETPPDSQANLPENKNTRIPQENSGQHE